MSSLQAEVDKLRDEWKRKRRGKPAPKLKVIAAVPDRRPLPVISSNNPEEIEPDRTFCFEEPIPLGELEGKSAVELYEMAVLTCRRQHGSPAREILIDVMAARLHLHAESVHASQSDLAIRSGYCISTIHRSQVWWGIRGLWPWKPKRGPSMTMVPLRTRLRSSPFKGVSYQPHDGKWRSVCQLNGKRTYLGLFRTEEKAARAYDAEAIRLRGAKARTNFPYPAYRPHPAEAVDA